MVWSFLDAPLQDCLVLASGREDEFIVQAEKHGCHVAGMAVAFDAVAVLDQAGILQNSQFSWVVAGDNQVHAWGVGPFGAIDGVDVSSVGELFPNALDGPSECDIPGGPFVVSGEGGARGDLFACVGVPEEEFVVSGGGVQVVAVFGEIELLYVAAVLRHLETLLHLALFPSK